ncbi:MAG TPA: cbb3-type cytochrome c oxidase subunit I, partial [Mycobacterium sp.]|nr:cbb3-type cytochrome c oxidase subunit I [Mycobacterium sp.]
TSTELISIPTSLVIMAAMGTMWRGRTRLKVPLVLVIFSIVNFIIGGISGTFLADVPADWFETDTFFVVAHFHYTILGGMVFAWMAAMYFYLPKFSGRMFHERWAMAMSWITFAFFNWTFFSMFFVGLNGMNRRVATYPPYLQTENLFISIPAWVLGASFAGHVIIIAHGWLRGRPAPANPWNAKTLEWQTSSPPPEHNFERDPIVVGDFYSYGKPDAPEPDLIPIPGIEEDAPITLDGGSPGERAPTETGGGS